MATSKRKESRSQEADIAKDAEAVQRKGPLKTIRIEDCSASLWPRTRVLDGQAITVYSVTFERSYVDKTGTRKYTGFFDPQSLGKIIQLCQQVDEAILTLQEAAKEEVPAGV